jgi:hypothetical protein
LIDVPEPIHVRLTAEIENMKLGGRRIGRRKKSKQHQQMLDETTLRECVLLSCCGVTPASSRHADCLSSVQTLESRRYLAGDLAIGEVDATPEEPARETMTITDTTISGNTANSEGGGPHVKVFDGANLAVVNEVTREDATDSYFSDLGGNESAQKQRRD